MRKTLGYEQHMPNLERVPEVVSKMKALGVKSLVLNWCENCFVDCLLIVSDSMIEQIKQSGYRVIRKSLQHGDAIILRYDLIYGSIDTNDRPRSAIRLRNNNYCRLGGDIGSVVNRFVGDKSELRVLHKMSSNASNNARIKLIEDGETFVIDGETVIRTAFKADSRIEVVGTVNIIRTAEATKLTLDSIIVTKFTVDSSVWETRDMTLVLLNNSCILVSITKLNLAEIFKILKVVKSKQDIKLINGIIQAISKCSKSDIELDSIGFIKALSFELKFDEAGNAFATNLKNEINPSETITGPKDMDKITAVLLHNLLVYQRLT